MRRIPRYSAVETYIKRIIFAHLVLKLFANPLPDCRTRFCVKPAAFLNLLDDPFLLALLCEDPRETDIVGCSPEGKVAQKENLRCASREGEVQRELRPEQREIEQIDMRFGVARVEEC